MFPVGSSKEESEREQKEKKEKDWDVLRSFKIKKTQSIIEEEEKENCFYKSKKEKRES